MQERDILSNNSSYALKIVTTKIAIMWCDIFVFLSDETKNKENLKQKEIAEGYIDNPNCLFLKFKNM